MQVNGDDGTSSGFAPGPRSKGCGMTLGQIYWTHSA